MAALSQTSRPILTGPQVRQLRLAAHLEGGAFALAHEPMVAKLESAGLWDVRRTAHGACKLVATAAGRAWLKQAEVAW